MRRFNRLNRLNRLNHLLFPGLVTLLIGVAILCLAPTPEARAQAAAPGSLYAAGQYLPTSLGYPTTNYGNLNFNANITVIIIANQDTATHTVTIQDGTGVSLFPGLTIAAVGSANSTWVAPLNNARFTGGLKWSTDSGSKVYGWIVGTKGTIP